MGIDVLIIGSGCAGFTAGIYATRYNLRTLLIGKITGGQISEAYEIDNYPGFSSIGGIELSKKLKEHAEKLGVEMDLLSEVTEVRKSKGFFLVKTDQNKTYKAKSIIIATGSEKKKLNIENEEKFAGKGISYCATCDAPFFKNKIVGVVGAGDSAIKAALLLTEHAKKVFVIYRKARKNMKAFPYLIKEAEKNPKIKFILLSKVKEIRGGERVESVIIEKSGKKEELKLDGLFVEIGSVPNTKLAKKLGVDLDDKGHIKVNEDMSTNVRGVFAAGDVTTGSNRFEQIVTAEAEGAIASESAYKYIRNLGK
jgi:thioredoxin reductase (NADPH)